MNSTTPNWVELCCGWLRMWRDSAAQTAEQHSDRTRFETHGRGRRQGGNQYLLQSYERCLSSLEREIAAKSTLVENISRPADLACVKYFGPKICARLESEAKSYCLARGLVLEEMQIAENKEKDARKPASSNKNKRWVPKHGSTAYHALLGLYLASQGGISTTGVGKTELQRNVKSRLMLEMAGSSQKQVPVLGPALNTLCRRECAFVENRRYHLTDEGRSIAGELMRLEADTDQSTTRSSHALRSCPRSKTETWQAGSFDILLLLDTREIMAKTNRTGFAEGLSEMNVGSELAALPAGDILWVAEQKSTKRRAVLDVVIERKTLADLVSSIIDGRFDEQKRRLKKSGLKQIIYLIEEVGSSELLAKHEQRIKTAMSQLVILHNFIVRQSQSQNDTIAYLAAMHEVVLEQIDMDLTVVTPSLNSYEDDIQIARPLSSAPFGVDYDVFAEAMSKSSSQQISDVFAGMLQILPGISPEKAWAVQTLYPTLKSLLDAYSQLSSQIDCELLLHQQTAGNITRRRINALQSTTIYIYLAGTPRPR